MLGNMLQGLLHQENNTNANNFKIKIVTNEKKEIKQATVTYGLHFTFGRDMAKTWALHGQSIQITPHDWLQLFISPG